MVNHLITSFHRHEKALGVEHEAPGDIYVAATGGRLATMGLLIPAWVTATDIASTLDGDAQPNFPDEDNAQRIRIFFALPLDYPLQGAISITTIWRAAASGAVDLEEAQEYGADNAAAIVTTISAFTNVGAALSFSGANEFQTVASSVTAPNVKGGRFYRHTFRRNTGDANTGEITFWGVVVQGS